MSNKEIKKDEKSEGGEAIDSHPEIADRVPPTPTAEEAKIILDGRVAAFNVELKPLLKKHSFSLGAEAVIVDGKVLAKPILVDELNKPAETA